MRLSKWMTGLRLYRVCLCILTVGIVLPPLLLALRLAAEGFAQWNQLGLSGHSVVQRFQVLDLPRSMPWMARLPGVDHFGGHPPYVAGFKAHVLINVMAMLLFMVGRKRIVMILEGVAGWCNGADYRAQRMIVFTLVCMMVLSISWRIHFGFIHRGVGGWTFQGDGSRLSEDSGMWLEEVQSLSFLRDSIRGNPSLTSRVGTLSGNAMILHFAHGERLPANFELIGLARSEFVFENPARLDGNLCIPENDFFNLIAHNLEHRRRGMGFLLPLWMCMPSQINFTRVNYRDFPPATELESVSFWELVVRVNGVGDPTIVGAKLLKQIER